jgi:RNA polymerase sigma-70 factor, ECF subfamily
MEQARPGTPTVRLVTSTRDGEPAAALDHADALWRLARFLTRDPVEAEDLVQEAFARAFRAWSHYLPGTDLKAWLLRILRNAFLDRARAEARHPAEDGVDTADLPADADGFLRGDLELEQLRRVVAGEIEEALRSLPEALRTVTLLDLEGLAEAEVALVVGCPVGTVKSRLYRARSALRGRLAAYRR